MWKTYICLLLLQSFYKLSDGYQNITLQEYLCADKFITKIMSPFRGSPLLKLTEGQDSAAIITQVWDTTLGGLHSSNKLKYDCKFHVKTEDKQPHGIYIVITKLKFRRDFVSGNCFDYIEVSSDNRPPSKRICYDISSDDTAGRYIYDKRDRNFTVYIHIDESHRIFEPLELNMVLIAVPECKCIGDIVCNPMDKYSCNSLNDAGHHITNRMYPSKHEISRFYTANVAISANTPLIFTWIAMGFFVWIHTIAFRNISTYIFS